MPIQLLYLIIKEQHMKLGIREKIAIILMIGIELAFIEIWMRLGNRSLWDYISPLIPNLYF